jgi:hypothetical protein
MFNMKTFWFDGIFIGFVHAFLITLFSYGVFESSATF